MFETFPSSYLKVTSLLDQVGQSNNVILSDLYCLCVNIYFTEALLEVSESFSSIYRVYSNSYSSGCTRFDI